MILISDIHGCYKTLMCLLAKLPVKDEELIFLGDLVDRGPRSREVVQFCIDHKIPCVMGNHDHMMWASLLRTGLSIRGNDIDDIWMMNGGPKTLDSYGDKVPEDHIEFLKNMPLFIERPGLLLSHTGNGADGVDFYDKLWHRELLVDRPEFRVFGHTQQREPLITSKFALIDTGAAYPKYGKMTALQWPSMQITQQQFID